MALPTRSDTYNDRIVAQRDTYIRNKAVDVVFEPALRLGALFGAAKMPGTPKGDRALFSKRQVRTVRENGRTILVPLRYGQSSNTQAFTGLDTLNTNIDPTMTAMTEVYTNYSDFAALSWEEMQENQGDQRMVNLWDTRLDQMFCTLSDTLETASWSTNSPTSNPKRLRGIQHYLPTTPTSGTVWGVDRSTNSWHQSYALNQATTFATGGLSAMATAYNNVAGNGGFDKPTLISTTSVLWNAFTHEAEDIQRITSGRDAELGFDMCLYRGVPVVWSDDCASGVMYFENLNYAFVVLPNGSAFDTKSYDSPPDQAVAEMTRLFFRTQWGYERYDRQGVIYGFTDS